MARVAILGAGNLALTLAGDLARRLGQAPSIWAPISNRSSFNDVRRLGSLELVGPDYAGEFKPQLEDDLETAISGAAFIFLTVPTLGQQGILRELANFNLSSSVLVALPGSATSLACKQTLVPTFAPIAVIESTTSPYACRRVKARVLMLGVKATFEVATTQPLSEEVKGRFEVLFPNPPQWYQHPASIFFSNTNPVAHPAGILAARGSIEQGILPIPKFYRQFVPQAITRVIAIDEERLAIADALGLESETDFEYSKKWYGGHASNAKEFYENYEGYAEIETPKTMNHRYLIEDVKHILVLWVEIAEAIGVQVPEMKSVVQEASDVLNEDLSRTGRGLSSLNLGDANANAIVRALNGV
ncbi:vitopine synthase (plasmid) [Rhizobium rhizogenes]|uniref:lysopine/octopine dehydrogenase n=1 Tax=Rhizobium rhizogenes TaxID=359 RepID=UPI001574EB8C|nr:NAD/NADP-dependent octopine/nopaline dehydrogenase family protein [Rhizobium rhizogenes]NTI26715.1 vitopine synthase [Rhizobium rhizogenes]QTG10364.1 vitopine synthase [Rhizobium rhizogenes]